MKYIIILFLLLVFSAHSYSQNNDNLRINYTGDSLATDNIIEINLRLTPNISNGTFIKFLSAIKPAIRSVQIDNSEMWLINKNQIVDKNNVIAWYNQGEGIVLQYQNKQNGNMAIQIAYDTDLLKKIQSLTIEIYEIENVNQEISIRTEILSSAEVTLQNNSRDE